MKSRLSRSAGEHTEYGLVTFKWCGFRRSGKSQGGSSKKERASYDDGGATEDEAEWPIADEDTVSIAEFETW